jgi:threonine 3-dehydrogenase
VRGSPRQAAPRGSFVAENAGEAHSSGPKPCAVGHDRYGRRCVARMSGSSVAIHEGFHALRAGGRASLLGIPTEWVPLDLVNEVIFKGVTVQGIYGRRMYETWAQMTAWLTHGGLNLEALFGEQKPFEDFENAFRLLQSGFADKVLLTPHA